MKAIMPIWNKIEDNGHISISIPLLGIETFSNSENDIEQFVKEALTCFCIIAEKHGRGVEKELEALGWKTDASAKNSKADHILSVNPATPIYAGMMKTGDRAVLQVNL
jgi:hypothetical protein